MKKASDFKNNSKNIGILLFVAILLVGMLSFSLFLPPAMDCCAYETCVKKGYTESPEVWLAALAGETKTHDPANMAFELACRHGYTGSYDEWMRSLTGTTTQIRSKTAYSLALENGFSGSLSEWLDSLVPDPMSLGRSGRGEPLTNYELACEYGFEGSFTEWIVSLIS